jgi:hypothetical protein
VFCVPYPHICIPITLDLYMHLLFVAPKQTSLRICILLYP